MWGHTALDEDSPEIRISNGKFKLGPFAPRDVVEISIDTPEAQFIY